ncbi:MAG: hypothetical protein OXF72_10885 [Gammaproteobacteria bacterium]|nr:hypothetical protein [Gammaproteobacteria bacterium]MCY4200495.1 hypothetical protein [Gammaproteobacteria bacterium]
MNKTLPRLAIPLLFLLSTPLALANGDKDSEKESPTVILPTDFKKCAVKVFKKSTDVADVAEDCEAEMKAYIESLQPADDSTPDLLADAIRSGSSSEETRSSGSGSSSGEKTRTALAESYEQCVISVFDKSRSERSALDACQPKLNAYLSTVAAPAREQLSTLVLAAVHKALARRSLGQEG